ncbi:unnamed protein product [Dracunculus medinensis]|uniref:Methyltransferase domain-containing protein n=1 Tax=Dracunculus medinensis TaxID=318479 RepID=A0A158Q3I0_DRAME|nr:unnamed protein product [Dracunculus medinensis]
MSVVEDILQKKIAEKTKECEMRKMLGAPEVLQLGQNMIRLTKAKRVLDIGTFTGASALAWALALPIDGQVISMDITHDFLNKYGRDIIESKMDVAKKIDFKLGKAIDTLDSLIEAKQEGQWDFAFIDADKQNYLHYYQKSMQLLRHGGVIIVDNALWSGKVVAEEKDEETKNIDSLNRFVSADDRVDNILLNLGDGTHLIFKKYI